MTNSESNGELRGEPIVAPAFHRIGPEFMRKLKAAIDKTECAAGQKLDQKDFGAILGVPKSTIHDWLEGTLPEQIAAMLCGLERLSESEQLQLLREFCRACPRLDHPKLSHNPEIERNLVQALAQRDGLTIIEGAEERVCSFLFTAIGNSIGRHSPKRKVGGIDVHFPVDFSPIPGVHYIPRGTSPEITRAIIRRMWMRLRLSQHGVLMLNGVLGAATELAVDVGAISKTRHVILTGTPVPVLTKGFQRAGQRATLITASADKSRTQQISVSISYVVIGS